MSYHYRFPRKIFVLQTGIARVRHIRKARIKCAKCGLTPCEGANLRKVDPARFVGGIDMDDLISLMGEPEGEDDGEDEDLVLIARAEAVLPGQVRHGYARLTNINPEWDEETDDDETWFVTCLPEAEGAFPVTMIGDL